jgi:hypothetical protein
MGMIECRQVFAPHARADCNQREFGDGTPEEVVDGR